MIFFNKNYFSYNENMVFESFFDIFVIVWYYLKGIDSNNMKRNRIEVQHDNWN